MNNAPVSRRRPLTQLAQERVAAAVSAGDYAVDATVGNGHDTLFLARQVGATGHVWGFDVQAAALDKTRQQLLELGLAQRVSLLQLGHETLAGQLPAKARGQLSAVMFNLGYLPGGDKTLTTLPNTTLTALEAAWHNLRRDGLLSILVYRGHEGGQAEADAVANWLASHGGEALALETIESPGPVLYLARRC
jgi:predicted methyltransferase